MIPDQDLSRTVRVELSLMELSRKGKINIPLSGNCMWPVVRDGDTVTVEKFPYSALKYGDVAVFQTAPGAFHANSQFRSLKEAERASPPENYVGKITKIKRGLKDFFLDERSWPVRFFQLLVCPSNPYVLNLPKTLRLKFGKRP